ncbi:hypothetical protein IGI04_039374 [Brassica rapa subsp. trilocularis]|uniref:Uncharacterized protein n=1 Tax=Brassica rapa subsp. trilocularis TaxID=1813537 RepID=A0ABQ7KKP9_BRACM|nr:hypothetical protein IGI04_039374 [Brassica rapa subsp. trilocularis]
MQLRRTPHHTRPEKERGFQRRHATKNFSSAPPKYTEKKRRGQALSAVGLCGGGLFKGLEVHHKKSHDCHIFLRLSLYRDSHDQKYEEGKKLSLIWRAILDEYSELELTHLDKSCFTDSNTEQLYSDFVRRKRIHMNRNSDITLGGRGEKLQRKQSRESPLGGQLILRGKEERLKRAK